MDMHKEKDKDVRQQLKEFASVALKRVQCIQCGSILDSMQKFTCGHRVCKKCLKPKTSSCPCRNKLSRKKDERNDIVFNDMLTTLKTLLNLIDNYELESGHVITQKCSSVETIDRESIDKDKGGNKRNEKSSFCSESSSSTVDLTIPSAAHYAFKDLEKRNAVGETPLHTACKKGDITKVLQLLQNGANVNVKDYANWTPLHDAVNGGHLEVVKTLLEWGHLINVPGNMYVTPLHKAAMISNTEMMAVLISHGANGALRTYSGHTPGDLVETEIIQKLQSTNVIISKKEEKIPALIINSYCVYLSECDQMLIRNVKSDLLSNCKDLGIKITNKFTDSVTHMVVFAYIQDPKDYDTLFAIVKEIPVMTYDWLKACEKFKQIVPIDKYILMGAANFILEDTVRLSLKNRRSLNPKLFDGCSFYLLNFDKESEKSEAVFRKENMIKLIKAGNGTVLSREPHLRTVSFRTCYPWHAPRNSSIEKCFNYIIFRGSCELQYKMPEIRHMPALWIIECIWKFKLIPPNDITWTASQ